ncbi:MAG: peptidoglycan-binding protein [Oscillospiraceae bacterium]|jgi:uncharacterized protein YgiM (DUF1202 family)|nr:peptidoglycan-binding protein [Oscillospiraceae bacterium]
MHNLSAYKRGIALACAIACFWVSLAASGIAKAEETAYVLASKLVLRKAPERTGAPITQIPFGGEVTVLGQRGEWVQVTYKSHQGYVCGEYLVQTRPTAENTREAAAAQPATSAAAIAIVLRLGDSGEAVRALQAELRRCGYEVAADGYFGPQTQAVLVVFQRQAGIDADGLAGGQTMKKLAAAPTATQLQRVSTTPQVEKLDWWQGGSGAFPVGSRATVVDVRTGIRFSVKRWGGVNHADVEPITAADSAAMKRAYGGAWSWNRRAIWVLAGGRALAASMNGMPHMGYSIQDNQFGGHFCIHMQSSRTHGSNRVDEAHQAAVNTAYNNRSSFK